MDAVNAFNGELFSMIDMKPPISRAKMMSVTKAAIKAIKLYKHVVLIVEKFIKKCKPDLKVPGLYVVDSIVRQSRHQFGIEKDVFGPRFMKNFSATFQNLYLCPTDDKNKILRVLNLWQKNGVFTMDVIQPLLDMASAPLLPLLENGFVEGSPPITMPPETSLPVSSTSLAAALPQLQNSGALAAVAQLFQSTQGHELQQILQTLQQPHMSAETPPPRQTQAAAQTSSFDKKLLDRFDYDDEPEPAEDVNRDAAPSVPEDIHGSLQQSLLSQILAQMPSVIMPSVSQSYPQLLGEAAHQVTAVPLVPHHQIPAFVPEEQREGKDRTQVRRSRSRSPRRHSPSHSRRSRSGSRSRRSRFRDGRSRSRERRSREWQSPRSRSQERRERERERERRQKGLPPMKSKALAVCTTTLWVGQLDKKTHQQDISSLLEEFGQIESINMIPPRGCAYIVMVHRQDAYRALTKLSRGTVKINQKAIKIAWALNKGIKGELKQFWNVERGVTYIPWSKVNVSELESIREGGMLDPDTLNPDWSGAVTGLVKGRGWADGAQVEQMEASAVQMPVAQAAGVVGSSSFPVHRAALHPGAPPPFTHAGLDPTRIPFGFPLPGVVPAGGAPGHKTSLSGTPLEDPSDPENLTDLSVSPPPPAGLLGPRPGVMPLQRPPGAPAQFMQHFPPDMPLPHMAPVAPHMMARGPNSVMYREAAGRFRMAVHHPPLDDFSPPMEGFSPRGPHMEDWEGGRFGNDWQGFEPDHEPGWFQDEPPPRGGGPGGRGWGRDRPGGPSHFMNRHEGY
ncbi:splicing factor, arginine/serine-rich 15-like isoform X2 [Denticeps clupeoides]|uniref:splicing factor, arginine/serine-rich 15-like isoform X2 n=1 Tax=Denticeps clupeoides TaxID=299321 RepID=UPI0010A4E015|nr:splicing factor, arginine/serine-rich 15-like isoform X2 [Denticeps clupeoides]